MAENDKFADEILSDDELDKVAGGEAGEIANDSRFLNSLNGSTNRYGEFRVIFSARCFNKEIEDGWATVGIEAHVNSGVGGFGKKNTYTRMDNGQSLTQEQARQYAMEVTGHHMTEKDWNC